MKDLDPHLGSRLLQGVQLALIMIL